MNEISAGVVMSSAYCDAGLVGDFGMLPPAFLPVANRALYKHQFEELKAENDELILTVPADFVLSQQDRRWLDEEKVRILRIPAALSLLQAVYFVLEVVKHASHITILLGDTIVQDIASAPRNSVAVKTTKNHFEWSEVKPTEDGVLSLERGVGDGVSPREILSGLYKFANANYLREVAANTLSFDQAIEAYSRKFPMKQVDLPWFDFGKPTLFYQSRRDFLSTRYFNSLEVFGNVLSKKGKNISKLKDEALWFANLPLNLRLSCPTYLGEAELTSGYEYRLEYMYLPTVAELALFGDLPRFQWQVIAQRCIDFLQDCRDVEIETSATDRERIAKGFYHDVVVDKTRQRLETFSSDVGFDLSRPFTLNGIEYPSVETLYDLTHRLIPPPQARSVSFLHGDFFFGNILFDSRSGNIKAIDPRGTRFLGQKLSLGDWRYDFAKLAHSVVGHYDAILAEMVVFRQHDSHNCDLVFPDGMADSNSKAVFQELEVEGLTIMSDEILAQTIFLFLAMIPLHKESPARQVAFLANAYRLAANDLRLI